MTVPPVTFVCVLSKVQCPNHHVCFCKNTVPTRFIAGGNKQNRDNILNLVYQYLSLDQKTPKGKEIVTELIWPVSFIRKERYLSGSIHEQPISFLFCSGQPLTAWMSISRTTIFNGRRCNYDNNNIKVHNLKITAPVHHSSLFLLWNLHDSCPSSFWRHMLSR